MSNPGSGIRGTSPQPRSVSPGMARTSGNTLYSDVKKIQPPGTVQPTVAPGPPPPTTTQSYTGPAWHPQGPGLLAPPAHQTVYAQRPPPQGVQHHPEITVSAPPGYNRAPIYSVPPSQGYNYPPAVTYGGYPPAATYGGSHVGSMVGGVYPGQGYSQVSGYNYPR